MAAFVVITLVSIFSRSAAAVSGSVITVASAVEFSLVQRPDQFLRGLGNGSFRGHHLGEHFQPVCSGGKWVGDNRSFCHPISSLSSLVSSSCLVAVLSPAADVVRRQLAQSNAESCPVWHPGRPVASRCWSCARQSKQHQPGTASPAARGF